MEWAVVVEEVVVAVAVAARVTSFTTKAASISGARSRFAEWR